MIPATAEQRLHSLRQQLAAKPELLELIEAVGADVVASLYQRTHAQIDSHADVSHTLGQAKGVSSFVSQITAAPTSTSRSR